MRYRRLIFLALLAACKAIPPTSSPTKYTEDLRVHRPPMEYNVTDSSSTTTVTQKEYIPMRGHIQAELDSIIQVSIVQNKAGVLIDGYVIQIYTGNSRNTANRIRNQMSGYFPELAPKVSYHQPNFRVKAGKFTDRLEANRYLHNIKKEFPKALLIPERFTLTYE